MKYLFDTFFKYEKDNFLILLDGKVKYIINPYNIKNITRSGNVLSINFRNDTSYSLPFINIENAILAFDLLQDRLDYFISNNVDYIYIDSDIKKYIDSIIIPSGNIPSGGLLNQVLRKKSNVDYDIEWGDVISLNDIRYDNINYIYTNLDTINKTIIGAINEINDIPNYITKYGNSIIIDWNITSWINRNIDFTIDNSGGIIGGTANFVLGSNNIISSSYSFVHGSNSQLNGDNTFAFGNDIITNGIHSIGFGKGHFTYGYAQLSIGYNSDHIINTNRTLPVLGDPIFIVGNGTGLNIGERSNAYVLFNNGTSIQYGIANYADDYSLNYTNRSLVDKEYVDNLEFNSGSIYEFSIDDNNHLILNIIGNNHLSFSISDDGHLIIDYT